VVKGQKRSLIGSVVCLDWNRVSAPHARWYTQGASGAGSVEYLTQVGDMLGERAAAGRKLAMAFLRRKRWLPLI
jgi:hypothetical protein